jgi:hypothetical protein
MVLRRRTEEELARRSAGPVRSGPVCRQALVIEPHPEPHGCAETAGHPSTVTAAVAAAASG